MNAKDGATHGAHEDERWREAKRRRIRELEAELESHREALRECVRLSGADLSGGFPTRPSLPAFAVQQVRELRDDYDAALKEAA